MVGMQPMLTQTPPSLSLLDHRRAEPELRGADGADVARRSTAEDDHVETSGHNVLGKRWLPVGTRPVRPVTTPVPRGFSKHPLQRPQNCAPVAPSITR